MNFKKISKKVKAVVLLAAVIVTSIPNGFLNSGIVKAEGEDVNLTTNCGLIYSFRNMQVKVGETSMDMKVDGTTFSLPDGVAVTSVTGLSGEMVVTLPEPDDRDELKYKAGSYLTFTLPDVFSTEEKTGVGTLGEEVICNYTIKDNVIKCVFTDSVDPKENLENVSFGVGFSLSLNLDKVGNETANLYAISPEGVTPAYTISLPKKPTAIDTVTKTGVLNEDNTVTWTIQIGTDAVKGASLKGITLTENWGDANLQTYKSAKVGETDIDLSSGSYTFSDDTVTAPATVTVVTALTDHAITSDEVPSVSNTATISAEDATRITGIKEATASVNIPKMKLDKNGKQLDGNTIEWTLTLNENKANVYACEVYDTLSEGLSVDEVAGVRVTGENGVTQNFTKGTPSDGEVTADTTKSKAGTYEITTEGGRQTLHVYFGTFHETYTIVFNTKLGASMPDNSTVVNKAFVNTFYPGGSGTGPAPKYGSPEISTDYKTVRIDIVGKGVDKTTGTLKWEITPSTKSTSYTKAEVTVVVPNDQSFAGVGDLSVVAKGNDLEKDTDYTATYDASTKKISVVFQKDKLAAKGVTLGDVKIDFATKALTYFATNQTETTYTEIAEVVLDDSTELKDTADVTQKLTSDWIKKDVSSSYNDTDREFFFTYVITVNPNGLTLNNVEVSDNLTDTLYQIDAPWDNMDYTKSITDNDKKVDNKYFYVANVESDTPELVPTWSTTSKEVTAKAETLTSAAKLTITVKLTDDGKDALKLGEALSQKILYGKNSATIDSDEITVDGGVSASVTGLKPDQVAVNKALMKNATQEMEGTSRTSRIKWTIDINAAGTELDSEVKILDTLPAGLSLDKDSVELYEVNHKTKGTLLDSTLGTKVTTGFSFTKQKKKEGQTDLTFTIPGGSKKSYRLVYSTVMADGPKSYENTACVAGYDATSKDKKTFKAEGFDWATGKRFAVLTMRKTDVLSSNVPVQGAMYGIFESEADAAGGESAAIDSGYTDKDGYITFTVPGYKSNDPHSYFVKELKVPDAEDSAKNGGDYVLDSKVYEIKGVTSGKKTIGSTTGFGGSDPFTDKRKVEDSAVTETAELTNTFKADTTGGNKSTFKLYVYPTASKADRVEIKQLKAVDATKGEYAYDENASTTGIGGSASEVSGSDSISKISISGLPWGTYHLIETSTAGGFKKTDKEVIFTIGHDGKFSSADKNVDNEKTTFTVKDQTAGVAYQIKETETGKVWDLIYDHLKDDGKTFTGEMVQGKTYTINETTIPDGYQKHGEVKVENFDGEETVEIKETPIKLTVVVKDQDGKPVSDAGVVVKERDKTDSIATSTNGEVKLEGNISASKDYVVTGTLSNQYLPIVRESVTFHVDEKGTSFTAESTKAGVMSGSVDKNTLTITVQKIKANVEILEYSETDTEKKTPLTGGKFELHKVTGEGDSKTDTVVAKWSSVTDESDPTKPDISALEVGTYYIKQTDAPSGYNIISGNEKSAEFTIDASKNGETIEVKFVVHPVPGKITLTKKANGNVIKNNPAEYQLFVLSGTEYVPYKDASNKEVKATTNDDGVMVFENLPWGSYKVKETIAPKGYKLNSEMHGAYVIDATNQNIARDVSDDPTTVKIKTEGINISNGAEDETGATKDAIKASYTIKGDFADGLTELQVVDNGPNDSDPAVGSITVSNKFVLGNNYTFEQTAVDKPYLTNEHPFAEAQKIDTGDETVTVKNYMTRFGVKLTSEYDQILSGKFEIKDADGKTVVVNEFETPSLENAGVYEVCGLAPGTYTLVEKVAPVITDTNGIKKYYALDDTGIKFELKADNTVKVLSVNTVTWMVREYDHSLLNNGTVEGAKLGESGSFKKSKEAILTYANTPTVLQFNVAVRYNETCNEDKDAIAYLPGITYGIYKTSACDDGDLLAKTTTVKKENDEITNSMVGVLAVDGLPNSKDDNDFYYVRMIENKESNIEYDSNVYKIQVDNYLTPLLKKMDGSLAGRIELNVHRQDLTFVKKDAEDDTKLLEGSTYALYRKDSENAKTIANTTAPSATDPQFSILKNVATIPGLSYIFAASSVSAADSWTTKVAEATTGTDGSVTFTGVDVGVEYMIQEVKAPAGYQVSKDPIKVKFVRDTATNAISLQSVDHGNNTATIDSTGAITWNEPRLKVGIELTDESGKALPGGTLELYDAATGTKIDSWNTDGTQKVFSGMLTGGKTYIVRQTGTPNGYITAADYTFVAESKALSSSENYIQKVTLVDKRVVKSSKKKTNKEDENGTTDANAAGTLTDPANLGKTKKKSPKTGEWF